MPKLTPKKSSVSKQKIKNASKKISKKGSKNSHEDVASKVLMVEPISFFLNEQTATDNKFMVKVKDSSKKTSDQAIKEFKAMQKNLKANGIEVVNYKQMSEDQPDAIFPNNWFSTHKDSNIPGGLFFTYPMKAANRQAEVNPKIVKDIGKKNYKKVIHLPASYPGEALEGTGVLVFDHRLKKCYVSRSERARLSTLYDYMDVLNTHCVKKKYKVIPFVATDAGGTPIYHTNVMMAMLDRHVVCCTESISPLYREELIKELSEDREIIDLSRTEVGEMCGNMIQVKDSKTGELCVIMSSRARKGLTKKNLATIQKNYRIIDSDIGTIEKIGGGSARCMVAELF